MRRRRSASMAHGFTALMCTICHPGCILGIVPVGIHEFSQMVHKSQDASRLSYHCAVVSLFLLCGYGIVLYQVDINSQLKAAAWVDGVHLCRRTWSAAFMRRLFIESSPPCRTGQYALPWIVLRARCVGFSFMMSSWM